MIFGAADKPSRITPAASIKRKFGERVQTIRLQKKWTQDDLGDILGVDRAYISAIETGRTNVSLEGIGRIAKALKVTPSDLLKF